MNKPKPERRHPLGILAWLAFAGLCLSLYFLRPDLFEPDRIQSFFSSNLELGLLGYLVLATLRGLTLIPLTPLLFAGILVFPPLPLFLVNQVGVYTSSALIYYLARYLGFDAYFQARYPTQIARLTSLLDKAKLPVITTWGFFPFLPTDLIVYVCSVLRISALVTLLGVSIGEGVICAVYIFGGSAGLEVLEETLDDEDEEGGGKPEIPIPRPDQPSHFWNPSLSSANLEPPDIEPLRFHEPATTARLNLGVSE